MSITAAQPAERKSHRTAVVVAGIILAGAIAAVAIQLAADDGATEASTAAPATVEHIDGSELARIRLTGRAAERIGIETVATRAERGAASASVPYAALVYQPDGSTWVYTNPGGLVYVRDGVEVDRVEGGRAYLESGPAAGTRVVTVGAAELYGTEFEVDH